MNTWDKKIKVNMKGRKKSSVLEYYRNLWKKKAFRDNVKKNGVFIVASYGNKTIVRRKNIKVNNFDNLKELIKDHAVEFHTPSKNISRSYVDVDIPKSKLKSKRGIINTIINNLKNDKINIKMVKNSPSGVHIHSNTDKKKLIKSLRKIEQNNKKFHVGKTSRNKICLDPYEPNTSIPGSLSVRGNPYKIIK